MDADLDLNKAGSLPDGTKAAQSGGFGASASDVRQGFEKVPCERDNEYADDPNAQALLGGNPTNMRGGFLGRPEGWQR